MLLCSVIIIYHMLLRCKIIISLIGGQPVVLDDRHQFVLPVDMDANYLLEFYGRQFVFVRVVRLAVARKWVGSFVLLCKDA